MIIALVSIAIAIYIIIGMLLIKATPKRLLYGSWILTVLVALTWPYLLVKSSY